MREAELAQFERLEHLRDMVAELSKEKWRKVRPECLMMVYVELNKIGLNEGDL